jgi:murein DD-endopeptidase MepM/ murein hydrolase activator NlpD
MEVNLYNESQDINPMGSFRMKYSTPISVVLSLVFCLLTFGAQVSHAEASGLRYAPAGGVITSEFGYRVDPFTKKQRFHSGLDIASPVGTPIYAPEAGVVAFSGPYAGYGNMVLIKHDRKGLYTVYGHCSQSLVRDKQRIHPGQPVALMGSTGRSTGSHLHFEVHYNNQYMNPVDYLMFLQNEQVANGLIPRSDLLEQERLAPTPLPPAVGGPESPMDINTLLKQIERP